MSLSPLWRQERLSEEALRHAEKLIEGYAKAK
jgi:hypothetical protein